MPTTETLLFLVPVALAGGILGLMFFAGLWWTVRCLPDARYPALLSLASLLLRSTLTTAGLYWLMDGSLLRLTAALLGFLAARALLLRRLPAPLLPRG